MNTSENTPTTLAGVVPPDFRDNVIFRVMEVSPAPSKSSGNRMITLSTEIAWPSKVYHQVTNTEYVLEGIEQKFYLILEPKGKEGKGSPLAKVEGLYDRLGMDKNGLSDLDKPDIDAWKGIMFMAVATTSRAKQQKKIVEADGTKKYVDILNPRDGKPIYKGWEFKVDLDDIYDRVDVLPDGSDAKDARPY